jgi:hypothetical protein
MLIFSHNVNAANNQVQSSTPRRTIKIENEADIYAPINFTSEGVNRFLKHTYNKSLYKDVLPNNFSHFLQFLDYGKKTNQKDHFIKSVVRLFSKKLKGCTYVNAYAYSRMLEQLPLHVQHYVAPKELRNLKPLKDQVSDLIYGAFISRFAMCKQNPDMFLGGLSSEILDVINKEGSILQDAVSKEQVRQQLIRFLEVGLSKLVWSPEQPDEVWDSVKNIANQFAGLTEHNIITDMDDLDDLNWSLVNRFCFFIDIAGDELPPAFYTKVKEEIATHDVAFLETAEQEVNIEKKSDYVMHALLKGEATALARDRGIVIQS